MTEINNYEWIQRHVYIIFETSTDCYIHYHVYNTYMISIALHNDALVLIV